MNSPDGLAEIVLPCPDLAGTLAYFVDSLGFSLAQIFPADNPRVAVISGHGVRIRLDREATGDPGTIRIAVASPATAESVAPNGTRIHWVPANPPVSVPPAEHRFVHSSMDQRSWITGRAGMAYRDLVPDRQGGRFIASHIRIDSAGPVPDYVHFHRVRFQFIYCWKGWVRVVYQDQGDPFVLKAGDCVLQPPGIRHRVLESSGGLEVIEVGCPAEHETRTDPGMNLPTPDIRPGQKYGGQRFVRFQASEARWTPWDRPGLEQLDTGIGEATDGLVEVAVLRGTGEPATRPAEHGGELFLAVVLEGQATIHREAGHITLATGDACVVPPEMPFSLSMTEPASRVLCVSVPGKAVL